MSQAVKNRNAITRTVGKSRVQSLFVKACKANALDDRFKLTTPTQETNWGALRSDDPNGNLPDIFSNLSDGMMERLLQHPSFQIPQLSIDKLDLGEIQLPPVVNSAEKTPAGFGLSGPEGRAKKAENALWQVLLKPTEKTLDRARSKKHIVSALVYTLKMDPSKAEILAEEALKSSVVVAICESKRQALQVACLFRDRGLSVRITMQPTMDRSPRGRSDRVQEFAKLCQASIRGELLHLATTIERQQPTSQRLETSYESAWLQDAVACSDYLFAPADPVQEFFRKEEEKQKQAERRRQEELEKKKAQEKKNATSIKWSSGLGKIKSAATKKLEEEPGKEKQEEKRKSTMQWDSTLTSIGIVSARIVRLSPEVKELCRCTRLLFYGQTVKDKDPKDNPNQQQEEEPTYQETIGTKDEIATLYHCWSKLDRDHSGRTEIWTELRTLGKPLLKERMKEFPERYSSIDNPEEFVEGLVKKVDSSVKGKTSITIEDMMRMLWPCAKVGDLKTMKSWCRDIAQSIQRSKIKPPPILDQEAFAGLCSIFNLVDEDRSGMVTFEELIRFGVIEEYQRERYKREWDSDGNGEFDKIEFCEMMCPAGYRACKASKIGTASNGARVVYDKQLKHWRMEDAADELDVGWI
eukprot:TRINITY_DN66540_c0_g1_i1.p1 TRINITY_DN66540_c0_g1~~TRINITY_DN66540_c0_g1_i1.p1  ORF type:complete len:638 (-),score=111.18 TRINITY_DN66540_c0_g1_i1:261-2174(-)